MKNRKFAKSIAFSLVLAAPLLAGTFEDTVAEVFKAKTKQEVKVINVTDVAGIKGLKLLEIELLQGKQRAPIFASEDGKTLIGYSNAVFTTNAKTEETIKNVLASISNHNNANQDGKLNELFASIPKDQVITINNGTKKTYYYVTDPECPYCRNHLQEFDKYFSDSTVKVIIAPVHGPSSFKKGELIYQQAAKAKNSAEILKIMRKYFAEDYKLTEKESKVDYPTINKNVDVIFSSGLVRGVPKMHEVKE